MRYRGGDRKGSEIRTQVQMDHACAATWAGGRRLEVAICALVLVILLSRGLQPAHLLCELCVLREEAVAVVKKDRRNALIVSREANKEGA